MKPSRIIRLSFSNLWRRKFRTILTVLGMSVGIGAMTLLISFASGLEKANRDQILSSLELTQLAVSKTQASGGGFGGGFSGSSDEKDMFSADDVKTLSGLPHVTYAYIPIFLPGTRLVLGETKNDAFLSPFPTALISEKKKKEINKGAWWSNDSDSSVVLSAQTVEALKTTPDDIIGKTVKLEALTFDHNGGTSVGKTYDLTVVGVLAKQKQSFSPFGQDSIAQGIAEKIASENKFQGELSSSSTSVTVVVDDPANVTTVRQEVKDKGWFSSGVEELLDNINKGFLYMKIGLGVIGSIGLIVALIGITNSMLMAVLERTREIGVMAAIGASRRVVSWLFIAEAAWLGFLGAAVGVLGGFLVGRGIMAGVKAYFSFANKDAGDVETFLKFHVGIAFTLMTIGASVLLTIFAGWIPARRAAKQDPVKALRHE